MGIFPAKYTWDINATPSCTNDFIVYPTMTPGATSGTSAWGTVRFGSQGSFTASDGATLTITILSQSITLTARNTASATANTGLNFYIGNTGDLNRRQAAWAENLAAAINRNGYQVGVSATASEAGVVTIVATAAGTAGNSIQFSANALMTNPANLSATLSGDDLGGGVFRLTGGAATGVQPTLVAYNQLYKTTCTTGTGAVAAGSPNIFWSYNTGNGATVETSPALSLDGSQVAFVQRTSVSSGSPLTPGQAAHLVLLKWAAGSTGAHAATVAPTEVTNANYRTCTAPCMTKFALGANNQNSSPYVDYANDRIYVGDAYGRLHRFDNVFNGTPAAAASWPVTVSIGNMLSSPVFDSVSNQVFVGSSVSNVTSTLANAAAPGPNNFPAYSGGQLHRVDATTRAVVNSAQIGGLYSGSTLRNNAAGVYDGAIVDSLAGRVYAFVETDTSLACNDTSCKGIFQFTASFAANNAGVKRTIGRGEIAGRFQRIGQFDDAYWSSNPTSPTGNLYVCGSGPDNGTSRQPTVYRIPITANVMGTPVALASLTSLPTSGQIGASCSPISMIKNGANEYLFMGVTANGDQTATGCTGACIYMMQLQGASPNSDTLTTAAASIPAQGTRFMSVSASTAWNTSEAAVATTRTSGAVFTGMTITQRNAANSGNVNNPTGVTTVYRLRRAGTDAELTCPIGPGANTCTATGSSLYAVGNTIDVRVVNTAASATSNSMRVRVQLTGSGSSTTQAFAGLPATGGTSGIVVDNISSQAGASQVYFSTLTRPGRAVQASQAGLQ